MKTQRVTIKDQVVALALKGEELLEEEKVLFFNEHRSWFLTNSKEPPSIPFWWDTPGTSMFVTSPVDHLVFWINTDGEVFWQTKKVTQ